MKKLLLLTLGVVSLFFSDYAAGRISQPAYNFSDSTINDSLLKQIAAVDPKDGFKDLFIKGANADGFNTAQLNPLAISFVSDYMEQFGSRLMKMKTWGKPYFDVMSNILTQHKLPAELKYLSVIESDLKSYAVSWAGAVGPWQFMPATARNLGLRVSRSVDERTDFHKSTHAAARYLTQLFGIYGDWLLVIAAYNCGPGGVNAAIRKSGSRNFWKLQYHLPAESRKHVKKFIATHYIMEGEGGVTTLTKKEVDKILVNSANYNEADVNTMNISGKYNSLVISQFVKMDLAVFNQLNPNFDKNLSANGAIDLRLPTDKMLLFQANRPQILEQSIKLLLTMDGR
jgi:membrane-bound lytic murein transglycosylase D